MTQFFKTTYRATDGFQHRIEFVLGQWAVSTKRRLITRTTGRNMNKAYYDTKGEALTDFKTRK